MSKLKTICIKCEKELENSMSEYQPIGGTAFESHGHYGSTVTDFCDDTLTLVCVCDSCMQNAIDHGHAYFKSISEMKLR